MVRNPPQHSSRIQRRGRAVLAGAVLTAGLLTCGPGAFAQAQNTNVPRSALGGVAFPTASRNWNADADGSKKAEIEDAATVADRRCGTREFHLWTVRDAAAGTALRDRVNQTFEDAGWRFNLISRGDDARRTYSLARDGNELVMVWLPQAQGIGLLLCAAERDPSSEPPPAPPAPIPPAAAALPPPPPAAEPPAAPKDEDRIGPPTSNTAAKGDREDSQDRAAAEAPDYGPPPAIVGTSAAPGQAVAVQRDDRLRLVAWLIAGLLAAAGGFLAYRGLRARADGFGWRSALGEIIEARIEMFDQADRHGTVATWYEPMLVYSYSVDGEWFEGTRIRLRDVTTTDLDAAQTLVERYPVGEPIDIRYRADDPGDSALEVEPKRFDLSLMAGIGCVLLAVAVFFLVA